MMKKITRECVGEYCRGWGVGHPQGPVKVGEVCPMPSFLGLSRLWVNVPSPLKQKKKKPDATCLIWTAKVLLTFIVLISFLRRVTPFYL